MKVQCGQCPAKYAVSDDRIHDKKVRIHCKRCGASIVVDGKVDPPLVTSTPARPSMLPAESAPPHDGSPLGEPLPASERSPRAVAHTIVGGLEAPAERAQRSRPTPEPHAAEAERTPPPPSAAGLPSARSGLADPPSEADDSRWRVALTKQDLRWMTTAEVIEAYHAGAVKLETFVFRSGMPTWLTLLEVPEIAEALAEAGDDVGDPDALPPKSPSSLPPPRKSAPRAALPEAPIEDDDPGETLPFALVAERSSAVLSPLAEASAASDIVTSAAPREAPGARATPPDLAPQPEPVSAPAPPAPAFAAVQQASGGGNRWLWAVVVVVLLGAAALALPRFF